MIDIDKLVADTTLAAMAFPEYTFHPDRAVEERVRMAARHAIRSALREAAGVASGRAAEHQAVADQHEFANQDVRNENQAQANALREHARALLAAAGGEG